MFVTVFTPTFNRGYIIEKCYKSLQKQSWRNFEWIVIDDGSTDDTEEKIKRYQEEINDFSIIYKKVVNGGKHRAINRALELAKGELFFIVDSDDYLTENALKTIIEVESNIPRENKESFAGVCGRRGYGINEPIGGTFISEKEELDITMLERPKYGIWGDKAECFYTEILRKYPFPEFDGEKFLTECVVWDKIAYDGYKLRFFNDIIYICNYLQDGLTASALEKYVNSPKGWGLYIYQSGIYGKKMGVEKWKEYTKYYYCYRGKKSFLEIASNLHINPIVLWVRLFGIKVFLKMYDR